jgi:hypothetical protein
MEATGNVPDGGVTLDDLAPITEHGGPFLTVYLTTEGGVDNASARSDQRWRTLRAQLAEDGAPDELLDQVEEMVADAHTHGEVLVVITDGSGLMVVDHLDEPLDDDRGSWAPLPDLVPLVKARQSTVPYLLVLADRGGADLIAHVPGGENIEATTGDDDPARKVHPGGFSQRRYQQRAEEDWEATAREVATELRGLAERIGAALVILGGDVTARHLIVDALGDGHGLRIEMIEHGRADDGSEPWRDREVHRLVATVVAEQTVAMLDTFKEELGQDARAVEGAVDTVDALNQSAVAVLFVHDDPEPTVKIGDTPVPLGFDDDDFPPVVEHIEEAPLVDALIRAAIGTGAAVRVVPRSGPVEDGIGGILRWSTNG